MFIFLDRLRNCFVYIESDGQIMPISLHLDATIYVENWRPKVVVLCWMFTAVKATSVHAQNNVTLTKSFLY